MSYLVWRQYRAQAVIAGALLAAFAVIVVITGLQMASHFHAVVAACGHDCRWPADNLVLGSGPVSILVEFTLAVPAMLGMFLGAPLVARELETGTCSFAWTQTVTRRRWLAVKLAWLLLGALAWGAAIAALVTWWSGPRNAAYLNAFNPGTFDVQGVAPAAYSLFAMALGIAVGTVTRRVLVAVGITLGGFFAVRLSVMGWIRQHYMTPLTRYYNPLDNYQPPGAAWVIQQGVLDKSGTLLSPGNGQEVNGIPLSALPANCRALLGNGSDAISEAHMRQAVACVHAAGIRGFSTYQPAGRYWPFQWIEAGGFVALAAILIAVTFAVLRRRDA
jgi:hypothetical protein